MGTTRWRASVAGFLAAGAVLAMSWRDPVVWGAEQQRFRPNPQVTPPRDVAPRPTQIRPTVRLTAERAERFVDAAVRQLDYVPGEVVVRFRSLTTPAARQRALTALRGQPDLGDLEWHGPVAVVRDPTQPNAHILAQQLREQPEVAFAEPNYLARIEPGLDDRFRRPEAGTTESVRPVGAPNDEDYSGYQWNLSLINMPDAWDIQPGGTSDVIVAVLDTGLTLASQSQIFRIWTGSAFENVAMNFAANPDLSMSRVTDARDFAFLDPAGPVLDLDGHGTHVSSTIGEDTNNTMWLAGMAYNARIMPVKVCVGYWEVLIARAQSNTPLFPPSSSGGCAIVDIADGIRYAADRGAKVMNLSLAGTGAQQTVLDAMTYAVSRGAFVAVAMGNNYESGNPVMYPARYAQDVLGIMSVAAVGKTQGRAYYSSTGAHAEIAAPGGDSRVGGATDFGVVWQSTLFAPDQSPSILRPRFDRYDGVGYQGTSMATPHVAGLAALIAAQSPGISPANIERIIRATARDIGLTGKDDEFGYGLIQPQRVLFGWGIRR